MNNKSKNTLKNIRKKVPKFVILEICLTILLIIGVGAYFVYNHLERNNQPPVITIDESTNNFSVSATEEDFLMGVSAEDKEDGNVTDSIIIESISQLYNKNTRNIVYVAFDNNNHVSKLEREIKYTDYKSPEFTNGAYITVETGAPDEILEQLKATDVVDGDISNQIKLEINSVQKGIPGKYPIRATVTNSCGDVVTEDFVVTVAEKEAR